MRRSWWSASVQRVGVVARGVASSQAASRARSGFAKPSRRSLRASLEKAASPRRSSAAGASTTRARGPRGRGRDTHVRRHLVSVPLSRGLPKAREEEGADVRATGAYVRDEFFPSRAARVCRRARDASRFRPRARAKKIRAIAAHPGASPPHTGARPRGVSRCRCGQRWRRRATPRRACSFRGSRGRASTRAPPSPPPRSGRRRAGRRNRRAASTSSSSRFAPPHPPSLPRGSDDAPDRDHRLVAHHRHVPRVAIPPRAEPLTPGARALERARPPALT